MVAEFEVIDKVLGLDPGKYTVVGKVNEVAMVFGTFSDTVVKDESGKEYTIPTGNAQALGLIE